ncbi:MAG: Sec-independent protein translocase protein TatB [Hyphomicrobiaceae bacterium hypho_1]
MLDLGWSELLIVSIIALIVVGPKEFPALLRMISSITDMLRRQSNEFRKHFDDAIKQSGLEDIQSEFKQIKTEMIATARDTQHKFENDSNNLNITDWGIGEQSNSRNMSNPLKDKEDKCENNNWVDLHNRHILNSENLSSSNASTESDKYCSSHDSNDHELKTANTCATVERERAHDEMVNTREPHYDRSTSR